jgi:6-phosphogluconolactonase/glucosamine-6-phosphate isomerase/deaminase
VIFRKISEPEQIASYLAEVISAKLGSDKKVLWLISGGSVIPIAAQASKIIQGVDSNLFISLVDERPGKVGHPDSNWLQLQEAGLAYSNREYQEVLQNQPDQQQVTSYDAWLGRMLDTADYKIGLFGVGPDGHTAGILPGNTLKFSLDNVGYWDDGERQRISITPEGIAKLDEVVVFISGGPKRQVVDKLQSDQDPIDFPAQYLKKAAKLTVYNDWVGDN